MPVQRRSGNYLGSLKQSGHATCSTTTRRKKWLLSLRQSGTTKLPTSSTKRSVRDGSLKRKVTWPFRHSKHWTSNSYSFLPRPKCTDSHAHTDVVSMTASILPQHRAIKLISGQAIADCTTP